MFKRLTWLEFSINFEYEKFSKYIEFMEENILKEQSQLQHSYENHVKNYPPEEHGQIYEFMFEDEYYNIFEFFPRIMRTSALISLYSYLEKTLHTISKDCERTYKLKVGPNDIKHAGVRKYIFYLQKVVGLNINENEQLWKRIEAYNKIRNRFAHSPEEYYTLQDKTFFEQKVEGLIFEVDKFEPNNFKLKSIEKEINTNLLEAVLEALDFIRVEIEKKDELGS